eukprot:TRINITY_DN43505_c0_g1_i1.p1 TRINITY_DN43505_c0_g1~~TRINITY_DN43505_c0_g1_i1.p1  ORF type:complete len:218 (-),score=18.41 TRINITY_DN43505_c0_g1_i1:593-1246(-)
MVWNMEDGPRKMDYSGLNPNGRQTTPQWQTARTVKPYQMSHALQRAVAASLRSRSMPHGRYSEERPHEVAREDVMADEGDRRPAFPGVRAGSGEAGRGATSSAFASLEGGAGIQPRHARPTTLEQEAAASEQQDREELQPRLKRRVATVGHVADVAAAAILEPHVPLDARYQPREPEAPPPADQFLRQRNLQVFRRFYGEDEGVGGQTLDRGDGNSH